MVGSGWQGDYSVEDTACAGAIAQSILQQSDTPLIELYGNDEVIGGDRSLRTVERQSTQCFSPMQSRTTAFKVRRQRRS